MKPDNWSVPAHQLLLPAQAALCTVDLDVSGWWTPNFCYYFIIPKVQHHSSKNVSSWRDYKLRLRPCEHQWLRIKVTNDTPPLVWCCFFQNWRFHKDSVEPRTAAQPCLKHATHHYLSLRSFSSHVDPWLNPPRISFIFCLVCGKD